MSARDSSGQKGGLAELGTTSRTSAHSARASSCKASRLAENGAEALRSGLPQATRIQEQQRTGFNGGQKTKLDEQAQRLLDAVFDFPMAEDAAVFMLAANPELSWLAQCVQRCPLPPCWSVLEGRSGSDERYVDMRGGTVTDSTPVLHEFVGLARVMLFWRSNPCQGSLVARRLLAKHDSFVVQAAELRRSWSGPHMDQGTGFEYWYCPTSQQSTWGDPGAASEFLARVIDKLRQALPNDPEASATQPRMSARGAKVSIRQSEGWGRLPAWMTEPGSAAKEEALHDVVGMHREYSSHRKRRDRKCATAPSPIAPLTEDEGHVSSGSQRRHMLKKVTSERLEPLSHPPTPKATSSEDVTAARCFGVAREDASQAPKPPSEILSSLEAFKLETMPKVLKKPVPPPQASISVTTFLSKSDSAAECAPVAVPSEAEVGAGATVAGSLEEEDAVTLPVADSVIQKLDDIFDDAASGGSANTPTGADAAFISPISADAMGDVREHGTRGDAVFNSPVSVDAVVNLLEQSTGVDAALNSLTGADAVLNVHEQVAQLGLDLCNGLEATSPIERELHSPLDMPDAPPTIDAVDEAPASVTAEAPPTAEAKSDLSVEPPSLEPPPDVSDVEASPHQNPMQADEGAQDLSTETESYHTALQGRPEGMSDLEALSQTSIAAGTPVRSEKTSTTPKTGDMEAEPVCSTTAELSAFSTSRHLDAASEGGDAKDSAVTQEPDCSMASSRSPTASLGSMNMSGGKVMAKESQDMSTVSSGSPVASLPVLQVIDENDVAQEPVHAPAAGGSPTGSLSSGGVSAVGIEHEQDNVSPTAEGCLHHDISFSSNQDASFTSTQDASKRPVVKGCLSHDASFSSNQDASFSSNQGTAKKTRAPFTPQSRLLQDDASVIHTSMIHEAQAANHSPLTAATAQAKYLSPDDTSILNIADVSSASNGRVLTSVSPQANVSHDDTSIISLAEATSLKKPIVLNQLQLPAKKPQRVVETPLSWVEQRGYGSALRDLEFSEDLTWGAAPAFEDLEASANKGPIKGREAAVPPLPGGIATSSGTATLKPKKPPRGSAYRASPLRASCELDLLAEENIPAIADTAVSSTHGGRTTHLRPVAPPKGARPRGCSRIRMAPVGGA